MGLLNSFYPVKKSTPPATMKTEMPTITMADLLNLPSKAPPAALEGGAQGSRPTPAKKAVFAGARLEDETRQSARMVTWAARDAKNKPVWVHVLREGAVGAEVEAFVENAMRLQKLTREDGVEGLLGILSWSDDQKAFVTARYDIGCARDLPALGWELDRIASFFREFVETVEELHARGHFIGCLSPDDVLVTDELEPMIAWTGTSTSDKVRVGKDDAAYVAPELKSDATPDGLTDVFVAGRILETLSTDWLAGAKDGSRSAIKNIVAKATDENPERRHQSVRELLESVEQVLKEVPPQPAAPAGAAAPALAPERALEAPRPVVKPREPAARPVRKPLPSFTAVEDFGDVALVRPAWIGGGIAGLAVMCLVAYFLPLGTKPTMLVQVVGAAFAGFAAAGAPVAALRATLGRMIYAVAAASLVLVLGPVQIAALKGREHRLHAGGEGARHAELQRELARKHPRLANVDLQGYDLSARDLSEVSLHGSNLAAANLQGTNLTGADLEGADLTQAQLQGAKLQLVDLDAVTGLTSAFCSGATVMPSPWECVDGHPVNVAKGGRVMIAP